MVITQCGKTNILEAIFVSSLGKSFRTNKEKELININVGEEYASAKIKIEAEKENKKVQVVSEINEGKKFYINKIMVNKNSEILGNIYIVLFTPEDIGILKNEPNKRRRFLNIMISQLRPIYIYNLNQYNKVLEQRNNYLKQIKFEGKKEKDLDVWDEQLEKYGLKIYNYRKEFIEKINKEIKKIHLKSTEDKEEVQIKYISNINEKNLLNDLKEKRKIDIQRGYTEIGVQRDDFEIYINKKNVASYGSQGQKRSVIISLKLAEAKVIEEEVREKPILLLDDFMSELDKKRINGFIENIKENQVIITCTDSFNIPNTKYNLYKVTNAKVETIAGEK